MSRAIPSELLLQIFDEVEEQTDLLSIRSTSRTMSSLVTPICFRDIHVSDTPDCVMNMMSLQQNQTLASLVERIVFRQKVDGRVHEITSVKYRTHDTTFPVVLLNNIRDAFSDMSYFCRIRSLVFVFDSKCKNDDSIFYTDFHKSFGPNYNQHLQHTLFQAISRSFNTLYLENLTVCHLLADHFGSKSAFKSPEFAIVLSRLKMLHITGLSNSSHYWGSEPQYDNTIEVYSYTIPVGFLSPTQSSLTSLTLIADQSIEFWLEFDTLFYLHLTSLTLSGFIFDGTRDRSADVDGFILRHHGTLRDLHLSMCPMYLGALPDVAPVRWADFWRKLQECHHLERIVVRHPKDDYVIRDDDVPVPGIWCPKNLKIPGREEDKPAFEELVAICERRSGMMR